MGLQFETAANQADECVTIITDYSFGYRGRLVLQLETAANQADEYIAPKAYEPLVFAFAA